MEQLKESQSTDKLPVCELCGGSGSMDSGGVTPWGEEILIPCLCQEDEQPKP